MEIFHEYSPAHAKIALRPIPRFMIKKLQARGEARKAADLDCHTVIGRDAAERLVPK